MKNLWVQYFLYLGISDGCQSVYFAPDFKIIIIVRESISPSAPQAMLRIRARFQIVGNLVPIVKVTVTLQ